MTTTTCPSCGETLRRSSTPTTDDQGRKWFWRHVDTGFTVCADLLGRPTGAVVKA